MKKILILILLPLVLMTACAHEDEATAVPTEPHSSESDTSQEISTHTIRGYSFTVIDGEAVEAECDWLPEDKSLNEFGDSFTEEYTCEYESYKLEFDDEYYSDVTMITGKEPGPTVYVVGGLHGNEHAGWYAGVMLKKISIKAGRVCVLAPANSYGAENDVRTMPDGYDLNRSFLIDTQKARTESEIFASKIYEDIQSKDAEIVVDLHEARFIMEDRDFLGSTLIITSINGMEELFSGLLLGTQEGHITSGPYTISGPGPEGSINQAVTTGLQIPVITVETFRAYPMEQRVGDDLAIISYILQYYGLR